MCVRECLFVCMRMCGIVYENVWCVYELKMNVL